MQLFPHRYSDRGTVGASTPPVSPPATAQGSRRAQRIKSRRGFTLVEVMFASGIFVMVTLGVYAMLIKSYQMAALSRCRDDARAVIRTFADQFERLQTTDQVPAVTGPSYTRWLFFPEGGPSGRGLVWGALSNSNVFSNPLPAVAGLAVTLGEADHPINATVTRDISYLVASTGAASTTPQILAAGYLIRGKFAISFSINGKAYTESLTVTRAVP